MRNNAHAQTSGGRESNRRPTASPKESTPIGVWVIVILGLLSSLYTVIVSLALFQFGVVGLIIGLVLISIAFGQAYVLIGLVGLKQWAHTWALVLYGVGIVLNLLQWRPIGAVVSGIILVYLMSKSRLFVK